MTLVSKTMALQKKPDMLPKHTTKGLKFVLIFFGATLFFIIVQYGYVRIWKMTDTVPIIQGDTNVVQIKEVSLRNTDMFQWQGPVPEGYKLQEATTKQHVLINSYMSCGSRFTSHFFGFRNDSFYFYEPLWKFNVIAIYDKPNLECMVVGWMEECRTITGEELNTIPDESLTNQILPVAKKNNEQYFKEDINNSTAVDILIDMLTDVYKCRFDRLINLVVDNVHADPTLGGPSWEVYRQCRKEEDTPKLECLKRLEKVCKKADHIVTKVLRITTGSLDTLMERFDNLKVLHLYRDPRAIINSRRSWKGYPIVDGLGNAQKLCDKMVIDFVGGLDLMNRFTNRFKFVFYEDITSNVEYKTKELYKFLNMDPSLMKFEEDTSMKKIVNEAPIDSEAMKLEELRKKNNAYWWRMSLPYNIYGVVSDQCFKISLIFNLTTYNDEKALHDFSIPSMNLPNLFVIL